ncbi:hypothetical protein K432DRAFT_183505 [Lepidopterella palustris CBS 459.81]|uniref:Uncharacterized protein n=1 Tax=Lepidopterella palustris CBS 459.81 TaxID=1314670 RepID=A0A8E2JI60_9PEZI|nr:hypothetical protein K432DRAFT_183505 [Lepidopterella palustris CBS 459.81]
MICAFLVRDSWPVSSRPSSPTAALLPSRAAVPRQVGLGSRARTLDCNIPRALYDVPSRPSLSLSTVTPQYQFGRAAERPSRKHPSCNCGGAAVWQYHRGKLHATCNSTGVGLSEKPFAKRAREEIVSLKVMASSKNQIQNGIRFRMTNRSCSPPQTTRRGNPSPSRNWLAVRSVLLY